MSKTNKLEIGVAIPLYNREKYIEETLNSVLSQSVSACEIVIVDDGSTDNSSRILSRYKNKVKVIYTDNSGVSKARKLAVESTTTPWIAFCDSDDIWLPMHLERRVALLQSHPDIDFSFSDLQPFGPGSTPGRTYFSDAPTGWWSQFSVHENDDCLVMGNDAYIPFLRFNPASPVTTVMSRDLYDRIGGIDPRYSKMAAEDADMTRKAVLHGNVLCDFTVTARQRRHSGNMSAYILDNLLGKCRILEDHISLGIAPSSYHHAIREEIGTTLQEAFLAAYYADDLPGARSVIGRDDWSYRSLKDRARYLKLLLSAYIGKDE